MTISKRDERDYHIPTNAAEVVALLERRIEVHAWWRDWTATDSDEAKSASANGTGTVESHQRYIDQYQGAIDVIRGLSE